MCKWFKCSIFALLLNEFLETMLWNVLVRRYCLDHDYFLYTTFPHKGHHLEYDSDGTVSNSWIKVVVYKAWVKEMRKLVTTTVHMVNQCDFHGTSTSVEQHNVTLATLLGTVSIFLHFSNRYILNMYLLYFSINHRIGGIRDRYASNKSPTGISSDVIKGS